jgi:DNA sulfur modification protein DndD
MTLRLRRSWQVAKVRYVDRLEVWRDGLEDSLLAKAWDSQVENLLPVDLAPLFFFDGEQIAHIAEQEILPPSLRRAIQVLLGIATVDRVIANLDIIIRRTSANIDMQSDSAKKIRELDAARREAEYERQALQQEAAKIVADLDRTEQQLADAKSEYVRLGGGQLGEATVEEAAHAMAVEQSTLELRLIEQAAGPLPLILVVALLRKIKEQADKEERSQQAKTVIPILEERNRAIIDLVGESLQESLARELTNLLAGQVESFKGSAECPTIFHLSPASYALLTQLLLGQLQAARITTTELLDSYEEVQRQREFLELHRNAEHDSSHLSYVIDRMTQLAERVGELKRRQKEVVQQLGAIERRINDLVKDIERVGHELAERNEQERILKFAVKSKQAQQQVRALLLQERAQKLESAIQMALSQLLRKQNTVARIRLDPQTLGITLFDFHNRPISSATLSSGERQMLAVATLWGLTRVTPKKLPVIIDTPLARLDTKHRAHFVSHYLPHAGDQVIVLSTDSEITEADKNILSSLIGADYELHYDDTRGQSRLIPIMPLDLKGVTV